MWAILEKCWNTFPDERPTASDICNSLATMPIFLPSPNIGGRDEENRVGSLVQILDHVEKPTSPESDMRVMMMEGRSQTSAVNADLSGVSFEEEHNLIHEIPVKERNPTSRL